MGRKRFKVATEPIFNYWRLMHRTGCRRQDLRLPVVSRNPHRRARRRSRWTRGTLAHKSGPVVVDAVVDPLALSLPGVYNATSGERSAATNRTLDVSRYINVPMLVF
jgi:hypothetical protein